MQKPAAHHALFVALKGSNARRSWHSQVPELDHPVATGGDDDLLNGRKVHAPDGAFVSRAGGNQRSVVDVENLARSVLRPGGEILVVARDREGVDGLGVSHDGPNNGFLVGLLHRGSPDLYAVVFAAGNHANALPVLALRKQHGVNRTCVAQELGHTRKRLCVPDADRLVLAAGGDQVALARHRHRDANIRVTDEFGFG